MKFFRKKDILVLVVLLIACAVLWAVWRFCLGDEGRIAEIYHYSELVRTVRLDEHEDREFQVPGNETVRFHLYEDGSIAFVESDCKDQICVHTGKISRGGESAACLPNGLLLKVTTNEKNQEGELDAVV